jgi:hypothetical protein
LESLYYLHAQPPLFNAILAALLAVFDGAVWLPLYLLFALMALGVVLAAAAVVQEMTGSRVAGLASGAVILLSPSLIAYGHVLFHALPAAFLVTTSVWAVRRAAQRPSWRRLALVVLLIACETLLWSAFHAAWMALGLLFLFWAVKGARARVAALSALPLALVAAIIVKNGVLFGVWDMSSWTGMNLARITVQQLPKAEREAAVARGELSPVSRIRPFARLQWYRDIPDPQPSGIPLLDRRLKSNRQPNFHYLKYVEIARLYRRDALHVVRSRPGAYAAAVAKAFWMFYLRPATDFHVVDVPVRQLGNYADVYDAVIYGAPPGRRSKLDASPERRWSFWSTFATTGVLLKLWFLAALVGGPVWLLRMRRAGRLRTVSGLTAVALVAPLIYVTLVGTVAEIGENQRFRFAVEPAAIVLAAIGLTAAVRRIRRRLLSHRQFSSAAAGGVAGDRTTGASERTSTRPARCRAPRPAVPIADRAGMSSTGSA